MGEDGRDAEPACGWWVVGLSRRGGAGGVMGHDPGRAPVARRGGAVAGASRCEATAHSRERKWARKIV